MPDRLRRSILAALAAVPAFPAVRAFAAPALAPLAGTFALAGGTAKVSATLVATPLAATPGPTQATPVTLDIAMAPAGGGPTITRYDVELGKRLHVIAVSADMTAFVHEHGDRPAADGHFRVRMPLPHGGLWHVYADAVPSGLGQQVMRFDLDLGPGGAGVPAPAPPAAPPASPNPPVLEGRDGAYAVRFDTLALRAGQDAALPLHVLRDGKPAPDLTPFLGVAAHAVFIGVADLVYVHAHAAPAGKKAAGNASTRGMAGMTGMDHGHGSHVMPGMGAALPPGAKVSPDLVLHMRAPQAGTYRLWVQVMAGGQVRTMPFTVAVG